MHILLAEGKVPHVSSVLDFFVQEHDKRLVLMFPYYEPYPLDNLSIEETRVMMTQLLQVLSHSIYLSIYLSKVITIDSLFFFRYSLSDINMISPSNKLIRHCPEWRNFVLPISIFNRLTL